jgi:hypothetical protein
MQVASGLCVTDFEAFVPDCELEFGYNLADPGTGTTRDQQIAQADLDHLTQTLFGTVASPERIIELTREPLLVRLGWKARLEYRSRHEFPVDEALYQPHRSNRSPASCRAGPFTRWLYCSTGNAWFWQIYPPYADPPRSSRAHN